ncbi:MAG: peptidoglycan-binding domain-containing protein [Reichenbachiella sp.]|uniref:peptidoglycan-binding domain-containing protein n=1 Tax=Reichenbachiella sp. TaxID=2184521 RepID=UPI003265FCB6
MDLKELVPKVPTSVKELSENAEGIYVVTLQIWLKLLGYKSGTVGGKFESPFTDHVKAFKKDVMGLSSPSEKVDYSVWKKMDELLRAKLPPNPETMVRPPFPERVRFATDEAYTLALSDAFGKFGFQVPVLAGVYYLLVGDSGKAVMDNLPSGIYELELVETHEGDGVLGESNNLGALEIKLSDSSGTSRPGLIKLVNKTPDPVELKKIIQLFQTLASKRLKELLDDKGKEINPKIIDGKLNKSYKKIWNTYSDTWGQFYGAPWMGIMYDPTEQGKINVDPSELNWAKEETIKVLYKWGKKQLVVGSSRKKFITIKQLNKRNGLLPPPPTPPPSTPAIGKPPQLGMGAVLYQPSKSKEYADIDYTSSDYDSDTQQEFVKSFLQTEQNVLRIRMADKAAFDVQENAQKMKAKGFLMADASSKNLTTTEPVTLRIPLLIKRELIEGSTEILEFPPEGAVIKFIYKDGSIKPAATGYNLGNIILEQADKFNNGSPVMFIYIETKEGYSKVESTNEDFEDLPDRIVIEASKYSSFYYDYSPPIIAVLVPGNNNNGGRRTVATNMPTLFNENRERLSIGIYGLLILKFNFPRSTILTQNFINTHPLVKLRPEIGALQEEYSCDFGHNISEYKSNSKTYTNQWYRFLMRNDYFLKGFSGNQGQITVTKANMENAVERNIIRGIPASESAQRRVFQHSMRLVSNQPNPTQEENDYRAYKVSDPGSYNWVRIVDHGPAQDSTVEPGFDISGAKGLQKEYSPVVLALAIDRSGSMDDRERSRVERENNVPQRSGVRFQAPIPQRLYTRALKSVAHNLFTPDPKDVLAQLESFEYWGFHYNPYNPANGQWPVIIKPLIPNFINREPMEFPVTPTRHDNNVFEMKRLVQRPASASIKQKLVTEAEDITKPYTDYTPLGQAMQEITTDLLKKESEIQTADRTNNIERKITKVLILITDGNGTKTAKMIDASGNLVVTDASGNIVTLQSGQTIVEESGKLYLVERDGTRTEKSNWDPVIATPAPNQHLGSFRFTADENPRTLPTIPTTGGEGIIELIGYNIYPKTERPDLHSFGIAPVNGWTVYVHDVDNQGELDELMRALRSKYGL